MSTIRRRTFLGATLTGGAAALGCRSAQARASSGPGQGQGREGYPVLIGLSRKRFIGALTGAPVDARLSGSLAGLVFAALHGAAVLRVHDVRESCDALRVALELRRMRIQES